MNYQRQYDQLLGQKKELKRQIRLTKKKKVDLKDSLEVNEKARWIITEASRITQEVFKEKVESLVTMAIQAVFDRPFEFKLIMERKRNRLECRPVVMEGENEFNPKDDMGGGIIDIISFAFRVVLWSLEVPRSRNLFILDEPFKYTGDLVERAGAMVKELSSNLGIQIIIVTHDDALKEIADIAYHVGHDGVKSIVTQTKGQKQRRLKRRRK